MGGPPAGELGVGLTTPHRKKLACYEISQEASILQRYCIFGLTCQTSTNLSGFTFKLKKRKLGFSTDFLRGYDENGLLDGDAM
jgi:hypothetical protein